VGADGERRQYWAKLMDEATEFMRAIMAYPVEECGEPMASLVEAAEAAGVDVEFSSEKDTKLAQKLGQLQPFMAVFLHECVGQLASSGPT
jgi:hypothetical protein